MKIIKNIKFPRKIKKELKKVNYLKFRRDNVTSFLMFEGIEHGKVFNQQTWKLIHLINRQERTSSAKMREKAFEIIKEKIKRRK